MLLLTCALTPVILGLALNLLKDVKRGFRMFYALWAAILTSALAACMIFRDTGERLQLFYLTEQLSLSFRLTGNGKIYLALAALLWPLSILYAAEYMRHEEREGHFFTWYLLVFGAAVLFAAADNLFTLYIFYEMITLLTVPLVWHKQDEASGRAAKKYMIYLFGGAMLGFAAMMGLQAFGLGGFSSGASGAIPDNRLAWVRVLALCGFVGFGVKAAVLPLSAWLPAASVAPTPVTALLHAVAVVNAGVYAVARFLYDVIPLQAIRGTWAQEAMILLSAATVVFGSVMAVREKHVKRRLAWSTVANLSYMLSGISLLSDAGKAAGLLHMAFHSLMKIILFFCAGAVLVQTGRQQVRDMQGLGRKMPLTFFAFTLAGASLMGLPPLPGFISKYALAQSMLQVGGWMGWCALTALIISAILTVIYIFTVVYPAFFMRYQPILGETPPCDPGLCISVTLIVLCLLLIAAGIWGGQIAAWIAELAKGGAV